MQIIYRERIFPPKKMIFSNEFLGLDGKDREWSINNIDKVFVTVVIINVISRSVFIVLTVSVGSLPSH